MAEFSKISVKAATITGAVLGVLCGIFWSAWGMTGLSYAGMGMMGALFGAWGVAGAIIANVILGAIVGALIGIIYNWALSLK
ncbi:MAG: hypothetical protein V1847_03840 [Candidatus Diapherotrites archaeon]